MFKPYTRTMFVIDCVICAVWLVLFLSVLIWLAV